MSRLPRQRANRVCPIQARAFAAASLAPLTLRALPGARDMTTLPTVDFHSFHFRSFDFRSLLSDATP